MRTIIVQTWGKLGLGAIRVRVQDGESASAAAAASIARRHGLVWCGGPRSDGTALSRGRPESHHYTGMLGRPCPGGGYTPSGECWYSVRAGDAGVRWTDTGEARQARLAAEAAADAEEQARFERDLARDFKASGDSPLY